MRFVFVDRIVALEPGARIEVVKNVAASEDVFDDHFPGCPLFPGALIVEVFEQAAQLLIGATHAWTRVGRLERVPHASFRHFVRPGDQLLARCERQAGDDAGWTVAARATVGDRTVATATLELGLDAAEGAGAERAARLRELHRVLVTSPLELAGLEAR